MSDLPTPERLADELARDAGEDPAALNEAQRAADLASAEWMLERVRAAMGPAPTELLGEGHA